MLDFEKHKHRILFHPPLSIMSHKRCFGKKKLPAFLVEEQSLKHLSNRPSTLSLPANQSPLLRGVMPNSCTPDEQWHREKGHGHENPSQAAEALRRESDQIR